MNKQANNGFCNYLTNFVYEQYFEYFTLSESQVKYMDHYELCDVLKKDFNDYLNETCGGIGLDIVLHVVDEEVDFIAIAYKLLRQQTYS